MCFFFLCFSSPARVAFGWKFEKKKNQCQNQTRRRDRRRGRHTCMLHLHTRGYRSNFFTVIARRRRDKNFLLLRSVMEEDNRINVSYPSLFKKHDAFHSCTFVKALSKFQCLLAMIKRQSSASESGHGEPKATMPPVEIAKNRLCWEYWSLALIKPGCVLDLESKTRWSLTFSERFQEDECVRNVDRLKRVENVLCLRRKVK